MIESEHLSTPYLVPYWYPTVFHSKVPVLQIILKTTHANIHQSNFDTLRALTDSDYALVSFSEFFYHTTVIIVITSIAKCEARIGHRIILDQLLDLSCTDVHSVAEVEFPPLVQRQF